MKGHPQSLSLIELDLDTRTLDFFDTLKAEVEKDKRIRWSWTEKVRRFHARRYALDKRKPTFPFPGSADIWPPLTDMIIEQMKSMYLNLLLLSSPPVSALAMGEDEMNRAADVEKWFEYEINYDSPDFMREQHYFIDDLLSCGFGILKCYWEYQTRTAPETLSLDRLPTSIAERVVRADLPKDLASLYLSPKLFDEIAYKPMDIGGELHPSTASLIAKSYDLDLQDKIDQKAMQKFLQWLRDGAQGEIVIKKRDTIVDAAATTAVLGENLILAGDAGDVEDSFHVTHEMWLTDFQVRQRERDANWISSSVKELLESGKGLEDPRFQRSGIQAIESQRQGMNWTGGNRYYILESGTYFDYDRDGVDEKVIFLWSPSAEKPLKAYAYPGIKQRWPYFIAEFERNKRGIYAARGIPERLQDIEREMVVQKRAELNRFMISSALTLLVRANTPLSNQAVKWIPGEKLTVNDIDRDVKPLVFPDLSVQFQQQERIWKVWAESYTGTPNYALGNENNLNEARTAREVSAIQGAGRAIGNVKTSIYREVMSKVFHEMFDLYQIWGPPEKWVFTTAGEPLKLTKEQLQGAYNFILGPLVGMDDPTLEAQKNLAQIEILTKVMQSGVLGPEYELNIGAAIEMWLRKTDPRAAKKIVRRRTPEELQEIEQDQQRMHAIQGTMAGLQAAGTVTGNGKP